MTAAVSNAPAPGSATPKSVSDGPEGAARQAGERAEPGIVITSRAAKVMQQQLVKRGTPQAAIRLGIRGGGCTGYAYLFEFADDGGRKSDHAFEKDGVRLVVDPKSMVLLNGLTLDFETGIRGHGFRFDNPNVSDSCGCGESISF